MKKILNILLLLGFAAFISGVLSPVSAATMYTAETDFIADLDSYYLDNFSDLEMNGGGSSLTREPVNGFSYTITAKDSSGNQDLYHMDGSLSTNGPADSLVFTFTGNDVTAFGGFLWPTTLDCENASAGMSVELYFTGATTETFLIKNTEYRIFTGFTSNEAITSIVISANSDSVWTDGDGLFVSADHIYTGTSAVPVPGAVWLIGSGLLGLIGIRRKKS